ncbi:hypothetical protein N7475_010317 [Penicillium sp. IBT 31633x]|nr:hypothetical protein N7475_010317 [Penicillium sp. IBT 31633x]
MVDLMERASSEEWNSDQIELDMYADRIEPSHLVTPKARKLSSPYNGMTRSGQARRPSQMTTPAQGSTKFFLRKLSKFNEMLLNQKNKLEDATAQKRFESNRRSFGQTLNHCQEFFSILRGIKYSCATSGSNGSSTKSGRLFQADGRFDDLQSQTQTDTSSCSYASTTSLSGRSSSTSSAHQSLDIPTLFSILFCYTYLLQLYEEVFTSILDAVTGPVPTIPPTLSGLCVDGFELDVHNTLQLDCLINLSYNLLEKIETILIGSAGYSGILSGAKAGLLGDGLFTSFMEELYEPEEQTSISHVNEKREVRAKRLIRDIQAALKVIDL